MADNVTADAGSGGATFAADDIGSVYYPRCKITLGVDGTDDGDVSSTNPLPAILSANSGVDIGDVDVTSLPGSITGYSEDAATPGTIVGVPFVMERDDALATLTPVEGDWAGPRCSAEGALWVQDFNSDAILSALGGTLTVDGSGVTQPISAASLPLPSGASTAANQSTGNTALAAIQTAVEGSLDVSGATVTVDNGGTFATQIDGAALTALQLIDNIVATADAAAGGTPVGVPPLAVRDDALSSLTPIEGDFVPLRTDANGALWVIPSGTVSIQEASALDVSAATVTVDLGANNDVTIDNSSVVATEDGASGGSVTGIPTLAIRDDSLSALTPVEGDYVPLRVSSTGALHVTGGGGGTQYNIDDAGGATDTGTVLLAIRDDSLTTLTPVDGDYVGLRVNSTGALHVTGGGGGTEYTEDVATANPIVGTATMMERDDALGTLTPIEGDWASMRCSAEGALWTQDFNSDAILSALQGSLDVSGATVTVDLGANNDVTIDGSNSVYAHDAAGGTANGIMGMSQRDDEVGSTAIATADGDAQSLRSNMFGALKVTSMPDATSEVQFAVIDAASSGDNTLVAAAGAGIKIRVLAVFLVAAGSLTVRFESGASGTALTGQMNLTTNSGFTLPLNEYGWFETADNTLLNLELSAATSVDGCLVYVEV